MPKYNVEERFIEDLNSSRLDLVGLLDDSELFRDVPGAREALRGIAIIGDCLAAAVVHTPSQEIKTGLDRTPAPPIMEPEPAPTTLPELPDHVNPVLPPFNGFGPDDLNDALGGIDGDTSGEEVQGLLTGEDGTDHSSTGGSTLDGSDPGFNP